MEPLNLDLDPPPRLFDSLSDYSAPDEESEEMILCGNSRHRNRLHVEKPHGALFDLDVKTTAEKLIRNNAINGTDNMKCKFYEDYFIT